ncbi:MAG: FMN-binding negative transcriptional regulator [Bryobacterales bacterium]|nr:FMN-binding negative transcriptional regulator [Bryobacterales bacterium]
MKRRDLMAGLACAASAQHLQTPDPGTLYIPPAHRVGDLALLHETMDEFPFVDLITTTPSLRITHIPSWLDRKAGPYGTVFGHIARNNAQIAAIEARAAATIVYKGPHAYISPTWYENPHAVPTWNFAAVHVSGKLEPVSEPDALFQLLSTLVSRSEGKYENTGYTLEKLPRDYTGNMMKNILGFRLRIETMEGKFKLGQERSQSDRSRIVGKLRASKQGRNVVDFTEAFYNRR